MDTGYSLPSLIHPNSTLDLKCTDLETIERYIEDMEKCTLDILGQLRTETLAWKTRRNCLVPVYRIPEEVLIRVFCLLSNEPKPFIHEKNLWDWLQLTKICSRWRDIALRCPFLWVNIHKFTSTDKIRTFLERSKSAELFVDLTLRKENAGAIMDVLSRHMWRIQKCELTLVETETFWQSLSDHFRKFTSKNKSLTIHAYNSESRQRNVLPFLDLSSDTTSIRRDEIWLFGVSASWKSSMFHGLTKLALTSISGESKPTVSEILGIMEQSPNLKSLTLSYAGPKFSNNLEVKPFDVSQLRTFTTFDAEFKAIEQIFDCITISEEAEICLSFSNYTLARLKIFVPKLLGKRKGCDEVRINLHDNEIAIGAVMEPSECMDSLSIGLSIPRDDYRNGLQTSFGAVDIILRQPFFQNTTRVVIYFHGGHPDLLRPINESGWTHFLRLSSAMTEYLSIYLPEEEHGMEKDLIGAFSATIDNETDTISILPNLKELSINNADFSTRAGKSAHRALLKYMKKRNRIVGSDCKLDLGSCEGI